MTDRLPNAGLARIDPRKLRDYALNPRHDTGRYKAAFFAQMGYLADNWKRLDADIRVQHLSLFAEAGQASPYGVKYTITGPLIGPSGEERQVTTVWIIRPDQNWPELITIEPAASRKVNSDD